MVAVEQELRRRRFGAVVRLEVSASMPEQVVRILQRELEIDDERRGHRRGPPEPQRPDGVRQRHRPARPGLRTLGRHHPAAAAHRRRGAGQHVPRHPRGRRAASTIPTTRWATSVQRFIEQAADDPRVLAIKQTLYRADNDSPIVSALIRAAENGKQVAVPGRAEGAVRRGAQHRLGPRRWTTPASTSPTACRPQDPLPRPPWWSGARKAASAATCTSAPATTTPQTARLYTDLGLLTCDEELAADVTDLFNSLTGFARAPATGASWSPRTACASASSS